MIVKTDEEYFKLLNDSVAREIQVSYQYMVQHAKVEKLRRKVIKENILNGDSTTYDAIAGILKELAVQEMKHLASIMERIYILGGPEATTKPTKVTIGNTLKDFVKTDLASEEDALVLYRQVITKATQLGDWETEMMFKEIYSEEEAHLIKFQDYTEIEGEPDLGETPGHEFEKIFTQDYIDMLNKAVASEASAILQYTNQHERASTEALRRKKNPLEVVTGKNKPSVVSGLLKPIFMDEMKHFEMIAERVYEIKKEIKPDVNPIPKVGANADEFIMNDREAENTAIMLYRQIIEEARKRGDTKTRKIFEEIIVQEEDHYWIFDDYVP